MEGRRGLMFGVMVVLCLAGLEACPAAETDKPKATKKEAQTQEVKTEKPETQPEVVVYKFKDRQEMNEFQRMYQQVQFIETRIAVLEGYLAQERANLEQLNAQLFLKFKFLLEPNKQYSLDVVDMIIKEVSPHQEKN